MTELNFLKQYIVSINYLKINFTLSKNMFATQKTFKNILYKSSTGRKYL